MTVLDRRDLPLRPPPAPEAFVRISDLDVLRGAALGGALVINLAVFSVDGGAPLISNQLDRWIAIVREVLTDGKWYPIFAFLFGYSLALQLRGRHSMAVRRRRVARRLFIIALLGVAHGLLLYRWDVLLAYGVLGTLLYAARQLSTRTIMSVIVALFGFGAWLATEPSISPEAMGLTRIAGAPAVDIYQNGTLIDVIWLHAHNYWYNLAQEVFAQWPFILAMMFVGLLAERHMIFSVPVEQQRFRRYAYAIGFGSLIWNVVAEITKFDRTWRFTAFIGTLTMLGQTIGALALLTRPRPLRFWSAQLSVLGRMSLTNYLAQSLICTTLSFGYGFRLGRHLTPATQLAVFALIVVFQVLLSRWWMARHDHGPIEGLISAWVRREPHAIRVARRAH